MKISAKVEYAIRALILLGRHEGKIIPLGEISAMTIVPLRFLSQVLIELRDHGFVRSIRGKNGGYQLRLPPKQICVGEVIKKIEGPFVSLFCENSNGITSCEQEQNCSLKPFWLLINQSITDILYRTTISDLIDGCFVQIRQ